MCHLLLEMLPHGRSLHIQVLNLFYAGGSGKASAHPTELCVAMFQREVAISWLPSPEEKKAGEFPGAIYHDILMYDRTH